MEKSSLRGVRIISGLYKFATALFLLSAFGLPMAIVYDNKSLKFVISFMTILIVLSVLFYFIGRGLLKTKEWARKLAVALSVGAILFYLFSFLFGLIKANNNIRKPEVLPVIAVVILQGSIIYYLAHPKVKEQFKR